MIAKVVPDKRDKILDFCVRSFRTLPKGRTTLYRVARSLVGNPERILGTVDNQRFNVDTLDTNIAVNTYLYDVWEPPVSALWTSLLRPGMCVVDIGANKGYFSLLAAKRVLPGGRVFSYEPHPRNCEDIYTTIQANHHSHWTLRSAAISSVTGSAELYTPGWEEGVSGWGTLEKAASDNAGSINVPITTLEAEAQEFAMLPISLVKIDIEGHEKEALRGMLPLLQRGSIAMLFVEIHNYILGAAGVHEIMHMMEAVPYTPYLLQENQLSSREWRKIQSGSTPVAWESLLKPLNSTLLEQELGNHWIKVLWKHHNAPFGGN